MLDHLLLLLEGGSLLVLKYSHMVNRFYIATEVQLAPGVLGTKHNNTCGCCSCVMHSVCMHSAVSLAANVYNTGAGAKLLLLLWLCQACRLLLLLVGGCVVLLIHCHTHAWPCNDTLSRAAGCWAAAQMPRSRNILERA